MKHPLIILALIVAAINLNAQDDLLDMLEAEAPTENYRVGPTWKTMKLVNLHSTSMVKKKGLDFRVTHRFGSIGEKSGGGVHNLYGLDISDDIPGHPRRTGPSDPARLHASLRIPHRLYPPALHPPVPASASSWTSLRTPRRPFRRRCLPKLFLAL